MERFADEVTEEIYWTRLDQHRSVKAHKILWPLVAARGLQDVESFGPIRLFKNAPGRLGVEVEGKWHLTFRWVEGEGPFEIKFERH